MHDFRAEVSELDIDLVVHGDASPGSRFGSTARPGEEVAILDEGASHRPAGGAAQILVADDSAVPAALRILEGTPSDVETVAVLEVADAADVRDIRPGPQVTVHGAHGRDEGQAPGGLALRTLATLELPAEPRHAWIAGESGLVKGTRHPDVRREGPSSGSTPCSAPVTQSRPDAAKACASCDVVVVVVEGTPDHRDDIGAPPGHMYPCVSRTCSPRLVVDL